jgi:uncharacterized protein (TIGR02678 family)
MSERTVRRVVERPAPTPDLQAAQERRRAARALLRRPLLHADDSAGTGGGAAPGSQGADRAEELRLVRRHRDELTRTFADGLGYRLVVQPGGARLFKAGLGRDPGRGLLRRSGRPFSPRAYALLCLTVAALTRCRAQLLVDELVAEVRAAAVDAGIAVDLDTVADRRALHAALLVLLDLGVIRERDGDLEHWADQRTASLLDVRRDRLGLLLATPIGSARGRDELLDVAALPSAAGGARVAVRRRLAESPVMSVTDLTDEQQEWWSRNRHREREWFRDRLGLELELRAEGALAVDPDDELTDAPFPAGGSARHLALLWLAQVVHAVRDDARSAEPAERTWYPVSTEVVDRAAAEVLETWGAGLRRAHREDPGAARSEALEVLVAAGLVRTSATGWLVHAASARYAARPALGAPSASGEASLFDDDGGIQ